MYQIQYQGRQHNLPNSYDTDDPRDVIWAVAEPGTHGYIVQPARNGQPSRTRRFICDKLGRIYFTSEYVA